MKALLIAIACVAAAVGGLAACGGAADGESGAAQAQPPTSTSTPTPPTAAAQAQPTVAAISAAQAQPTATSTAVVQVQPTAIPTATAAAATATAPPSGTPETLRAPGFSLPSAYGGTVSLSGLLDGKDGAALVFYRGFF